MSIKIAQFDSMNGKIPVHVTNTGPGRFAVQASFKKININDLDLLSTTIGVVCHKVCAKFGGAETPANIEANRFSTTITKEVKVDDPSATVNDLVNAAKTDS